MVGDTGQAIAGVLKGLRLVLNACYLEQAKTCRRLWDNSSIRELLETNMQENLKCLQDAADVEKIQKLLKETQERSCVVAEGFRQLAILRFRSDVASNNRSGFISDIVPNSISVSRQNDKENNTVEMKAKATSNKTNSKGIHMSHSATDTTTSNLDISSITLNELEEMLSKRNRNEEISLRTKATKLKQITNVSSDMEGSSAKKFQFTDTDNSRHDNKPAIGDASIKVPALSDKAKQRRVPSSRVARIVSFGGLFAGVGLGTLNELTKGALGLGGSNSIREAFLSQANAERIVNTLCKVRGAALKIGQILSIQDSNIVSPELAKAFERVRQSADYMPSWQVERVMSAEFGSNWRQILQEFDEKPFAAASIGQVHRGVLKNGMQVAIKIQYPGVAQSIESDIDNLIGMMKIWNIFPPGLFIDNLVKVAKRELKWEVDYIRESNYTANFKQMIIAYPEYYVPIVIREMTTSYVLTTELVPGMALDKCLQLSYNHRKHIGESVLKLCLIELFELQCMQTDPNWSNFLYDSETRRLMLIDFGSTRFYEKEFINKYRKVIMYAVDNNRQGVLDISYDMGFLTGYESKQMKEAHIDAVMILGEIFRSKDDFDFGHQNTTERIARLVPTMVAHRLSPPPEEIYSIHRKLSGIFLLCSRLNIKMNCRRLYDEIIIEKFQSS